MNNKAPGCQFEITRGWRTGSACGRPLNRAVKDAIYCRTHCQQLGVPDDIPKSNRLKSVAPRPPPENPLDTTELDVLANAALIVTTPSEEEVLYEGTAEEVTNTMLELISRLRRDVRDSKK